MVLMSKRSDDSSKSEISEADAGGALMAWYQDAIRQHPEGLITQAQAATILSVSRVAVSRLVNRGYLQALYFPKPPDIIGIAVGEDDPTWLRILAWLGPKIGEEDAFVFTKACYVSFADVVSIWQRGDAKAKCAIDWNEVMASLKAEKGESKAGERYGKKAGKRREAGRLSPGGRKS